MAAKKSIKKKVSKNVKKTARKKIISSIKKKKVKLIKTVKKQVYKKSAHKKPINKKVKKPKVTKSVIVQDEKVIRSDWEANHALIYSAFIEYYNTTKKIPSKFELTKITGFSYQTIVNHIRKLNVFEMINSSEAKLALPLVIQNLTAAVLKDEDVKEIKLLLEVMAGKLESRDNNSEVQESIPFVSHLKNIKPVEDAQIMEVK